MALTRKMLTAMGIESDKIDQIIDSHSETVEGLKKQAEELRLQAAKVPELEKKIEDMEAEKPTEDWEKKFNAEHEAFELYKSQTEKEKADMEKARLYRAMLRESGIDEKRLDAIMKVTDLSSVNVKDGAIADAEAVKTAISNEWGDFITHTSTTGAQVDTPPANAGAKMTREDILKIKDTKERQQAIADNIELFR